MCSQITRDYVSSREVMANDQMIPPEQKVSGSLAHFHGLQAEVTDSLRQWSVYARCQVCCLIPGDLGAGGQTT